MTAQSLVNSHCKKKNNLSWNLILNWPWPITFKYVTFKKNHYISLQKLFFIHSFNKKQLLNKFFDLSPVSMYLLLWSREEKKIECWSTVPKINKPILHGRFLARSNGLGSRLHDRSQLAGLIPSPLYFPLESPGDIVRRCQHCHWLILQSRREREKKLPEKTKIKEKMRKRISRVPDSFHHINSCHFPGRENGLDEWQEFCRSCIPRFIFTNSLSKYNYTIVATLTWFTKTLKLTILITILCIKISFLGQKRSLMLHKKNQSMRHLCDKSVNSC